MSRIQHEAEGATALDRAWGLQPHFYEAFMADHAASIGRVDPVILEICRVRMAEIFDADFELGLRYKPAIEAGVTEEKLAAVSRSYNSPLFDKVERSCLAFAEQFAVQSSGIDDDDVKKLDAALGTEPMIYFIKALSVMDQLQRSTVGFGLGAPDGVPQSMPDFTLKQAA